jgi:hypothetical protein
MSGVANSLPR